MKKFLWFVFGFLVLLVITKITNNFAMIDFATGFVIIGGMCARADDRQLTTSGLLLMSFIYTILVIILFLLPEWIHEKIEISNTGYLFIIIGAFIGYLYYCEPPSTLQKTVA